MDWAQILVIILAVVFGILVLVGIILLFLLISITKQIRAVTSSAGRTVQTIEGAVAGLGRVSVPLRLAQLIISQLRKRKRH